MRRTVRFITDHYGRPAITCDDYEALYALMLHDKKNTAGTVFFKPARGTVTKAGLETITNAMGGASFPAKLIAADGSETNDLVMVLGASGTAYDTIADALAANQASYTLFDVAGVPYLDWDDVNKQMTNAMCVVFETYNGQTTLVAGKTYVVTGDVTVSTAITVNGTEANPTRLILCDGKKLTAKGGLAVSVHETVTNALVICAQSEDESTMGRLTATAPAGSTDIAGIGGKLRVPGGIVTINGGMVTSTGDKYGAGIGGGNVAGFVAVTVNGGVVTANGGESAAGIGAGGNGHGGMVTINGGKVNATGGAWGAGIGGGNNGHNGTVVINGGTVTATASGGAAGIGGGWGGNGGTVAINGGSVTATSGEQYGVAIGGGDAAAKPGTVTFGADFAYGVLADGLFKDQKAFSGNHTAKSVTTPAAGVKIPAPTGYSYVVSNETAQLAAELADGTNTYGVVTGATVKVYFTPDEGYTWKVPPTENPMVLAGLWTDTIVKLDQLPTAERALTVANVTTATHWPWDGKIDVTCDLTGAGKVQLSAALTTNGVTVCTAKAENLTGATVIDLDQVGGVTNGVKFVWNAKADCPAGFNSKDTKVKVTAKKVPLGGVQLWKDGPYWATVNLGEVEDHDPAYPAEYGALYNFADAVAEVAKLGDGWRLPTEEELQALVDNCTKNMETRKDGTGADITGCCFTGATDGYTDKSIFLPSAGTDLDRGEGREYEGSEGYGRYWSSTVWGDTDAGCLCFSDADDPYVSMNSRSTGLSVRAVRNAK